MKVLGIICLLAVCTFAQATGVVTGRVTWVSKNIERAQVVLRDRSTRVGFSVFTDANGNFRFDNVPIGTYEITGVGECFQGVASCSEPFASGEISVTAGADNQVNLSLTERRIEELVVIAAGDAQPISQISKTVNIITGQEMRDRADFTLIDSVRTIPGFRVQQLGGFGRTASIKSRGLRNQDTAVLIDGLRFRDPGSITGDATPFLSDFTLTSVSNIEILRGSGSSLYGTNAIGGTVDFRTPRAPAGLHGQVSGAAGGLGLGRFRGNLSYAPTDNEFGITGAVSRTAYSKGIDGNDNAGNTNLQTRVDYNPFSRTHLSGRLFASDANVKLNVGPDTFGPPSPVGEVIEAREGVNFLSDLDDPDSTQDSRFFTGQFSATHAFNDELVVGGYHQTLVTKRTNRDGLLGPGIFQSEFTSSFGGTVQTTNLHAAWTPNSVHALKGGYEFESEHFRNEGSTPSGTDDFWTRASQRSNTLYAQHLVSLLDGRLQLAGGARAQWFSLGRPEFSETDGPYANFPLSDPPAAYTFDGSASYFISRTGTKLRMHIGNGYRVPSLYERFGTFFFFGSFFAQGNPALKPERSIGIDAGVEQYFANQKVRASATYFYTKIKDEITYLPTDDFGAPVYYNFDRHYSRGLETSIEIRPTRSTDIFASYTFTNSDVRNVSRLGLIPSGSDSRALAIPDHQFTLVATQRFRRFWVSFDLLATSSYLAPVFSSATFARYIYRFDGNRRADLTAGYRFPLSKDRVSLRVFGTVENLLDHEYFENGFRTAGRNGRIGVSLGF